MTSAINFQLPIDSFPAIRDELRKTFRSGKLRPLAYRKQQLAQLAYMVQDNTEAFTKAIHADGGKPELEITVGETGALVNQVLHALSHLDQWAADTPVAESDIMPFHKGWELKTVKAPRGVALIIAPWNYPLILSLGPLIGAIMAGCCCVVKPSEIAPHYSDLLYELFPKYLDQTAYRVVPGAVPETTALLDLQWDQIMYTGNGRVGRIVATAAAKHLTPCALELGSMSPVVVDPELGPEKLRIAATRIVFGKVCHSGQTCISPDYVLVTKERQEALVGELKEVLRTFYPPDGKAVASGDFARIVNGVHFNRVKGLLARTKGTIVVGGDATDADGMYSIEPTIVTDVKRDDALFEEEIFGPILPIVAVDDIDAALDFINSLPNPLVIYVFSESDKTKKHIEENTLSGSIAYNDTLSVLSVLELPLRGVGESGYGAWMGKHSFDQFTLDRGSVDVPFRIESNMAYRYPPYTEPALAFFKEFAKQHIPIARASKVDQSGSGESLADKVKYLLAV